MPSLFLSFSPPLISPTFFSQASPFPLTHPHGGLSASRRREPFQLHSSSDCFLPQHRLPANPVRPEFNSFG
ncbi:uncharacterized protein BO87DRAFT_116581 [Aspergillus neoniger CBS 115656]|uniref:Uncharacterized protein n=1 Tax=Aspergillus neoniger (strain CBS 115656) TaxID=1448310 RepID=A0A318YHE6_ASPNB|nr:hypothetical protein BO87DRAFT_116581 [Aspergillus neoniger CBS 115656]PYH31943.1 hypothetical protein BO87DRAFT_116581 [Aspergillus neoniger CBS 115656]